MLFFDIDGTLFDHPSAEKAGALGFLDTRREIFSIPTPDFLGLWSDLMEKYYQLYLHGALTFSEQRRARVRELYNLAGYKITDQEADHAFQDYLEHYERAWTVYPDVVPCLTQLEHMGLGVITNGDYRQQTAKLKQVGIWQFFSLIVTSGEVGFAKPDRRIFLEACSRANREPAQCYYIGDLLETDYAGSTAAGLRGIWLNRNGRQLSSETPIPTLKSLQLLPSLVEQW